MTIDTPKITIPNELLPSDGRFGPGPSKIPVRHLDALSSQSKLLGTSHRQKPVKNLVKSIRHGLTELFSLPEGYEVILGNGGATAFWDAASFCLIEEKSSHAVFGEFSQKFAEVVNSAPFLKDASISKAEYGSLAILKEDPGVDAYALTHNETSTGVMSPISRLGGEESITLVDATSAAGGVIVDPTQFDCYYFSPQKCFASDGGIYFALLSPRAIDRIERLCAKRYVPMFLNLKTALDNSRSDQTYNTPATATLFLMDLQISFLLERGGLKFADERTKRSSEIIYSWAEASDFATPFVGNPQHRSQVVATIDLVPEVDAKQVSAILRENGIVDIDSYRKLGRNQLRVALFPAIEPEDVSLLCGAINYVVSRIS